MNEEPGEPQPQNTDLVIPARTAKPRESGLTIAIDRGYGIHLLQDLLETSREFVDYIKFGWGTGYVTANLMGKIEAIRRNGVGFFFGGTLLEAFVLQNNVDAFRRFVDQYQPSLVEVSDGTVQFNPGKKQKLIQVLASDFKVISEVGKKDPDEYMSPTSWIEQMQADLDAGAWKVTCEARENGGAGIFRKTGELRYGLIDEIINKIPVERIIFEAPMKSAQLWFIERFSTNVNLANIAFFDVIPLETLRLGLRGDNLRAKGHRITSDWLAD